MLRLLSPAADLTWSTPWAEMGQGTIPAITPPLSEARKIGVTFNRELPTGRADVL
jgi:hypothetical protein